MKQRQRSVHRQSGYTLAELLVVAGIIGMISLISVPQFLAFQKSNQLKTSMRQVMSDLRLARAQAIALRVPTRLRFRSNSRSYVVESLNPNGTWSGLTRTGTGSGERTIESGCTLTTPAGLQTVTIGGNAYNTVVFQQDGTATLTAASGTFAIRTAHALTRTSYTVQVQPPGFVKVV